MLHTRHGWWLEEAGEVTPTRPLEGDARADVVIVGGGYLGMWTAWHLLELEPELDVVVLESAVCGHGPSGRNGGFCESLWGDAPTLREHAGADAALGALLIDFDSTRDVAFWISFLLVGAALMLVGQLVVPPGGRSALLVSLGAALGGLPLFWTLVVPVAVAAVVACSIALVRRTAPAA